MKEYKLMFEIDAKPFYSKMLFHVLRLFKYLPSYDEDNIGMTGGS